MLGILFAFSTVAVFGWFTVMKIYPSWITNSSLIRRVVRKCFGQPFSIHLRFKPQIYIFFKKPHLLMVRFSPIYAKSTVDLFEQNETHELVREGHFGKGEGFVRPFHYLFT